jgi:hypothetical protein
LWHNSCCFDRVQVWVYGNSFKSVLVAVVVPKEDAIKSWAAANGKSGELGVRPDAGGGEHGSLFCLSWVIAVLWFSAWIDSSEHWLSVAAL